MTHSKSRPGFTLIELIIVVAIIAIIAAGAFVAIDPSKRLNTSRNGKRWSDTTAILQAVKTYQADTSGNIPTSIDTASGSVQIIGESVGTCSDITCTGQTVVSSGCEVNNFDTLLRAYLKKIPKDPSTGSDDDTRYYVNRDAYGIVSVGACDAQGEGSGGGAPIPLIEVTN